MATSYTNEGGTGDRLTTRPVVTTDGAIAFGTAEKVVDGLKTETSGRAFQFASGSQHSKYIRFDFLTAHKIDEIKYFGTNLQTVGTFDIIASNDLVQWHVLSASVALTGTGGTGAGVVIGNLSGNTNYYRYYELRQISNNTLNINAWLVEFEFKLEAGTASAPAATPSYVNYGGRGVRASLITITTTVAFSSGNSGQLINGTHNSEAWFTSAQTLRRLSFDFGVGKSKVVTEAKWFQDGTNAQGTWKWQGSNDGSSWVDISATFTLSGAVAGTVMGDLSANATGYRHYSLLQTAGTTTSAVYTKEIEFKLAEYVAPSGFVRKRRIILIG